MTTGSPPKAPTAAPALLSTSRDNTLAQKHDPVLYWIIVLMWLCFSIIALSTAPIQGKAEPLRPLIEYHAGTSPLSQTVLDDRFGFRLLLPENWEINSRTEDQYSRSFTAEPIDKRGSVTLVTARYDKKIDLEHFRRDIAGELAKDLPVLQDGGATPLPDFLSKQSTVEHVPPLQIFSSKGRWEDHELLVITGYTVSGKVGYYLIGTTEHGDDQTLAMLKQVLSSFTITRR